MNIKNIILISSIIINLVLISFLIVSIKNQEADLNHVLLPDENIELTFHCCADITIEEKHGIQNDIVYNQMFYGTWKIVNLVPPDFSIPSSYTALNSEGELIRDVNSVIGIEFTFNNNFIEHEGEKYELLYGFETYSHALHSDNDRIFYNKADTLNITGEYYSYVYFIHPNNTRNEEFVDHDRLNQILAEDLMFLILKDNNTIYISNGVLIYRMVRFH